MLDIYKSYLSNKSYFIMYDDYLYLFNYSKLIDLNSNFVSFILDNKEYIIKGTNISMCSLSKKEILIKGSYESVIIHDTNQSN